MDYGRVGNNEVTACPYCDQLFTVKTGEDNLGVFMKLHDEHMASSAPCREARDNQPSLDELFAAMRPGFQAAAEEDRKRLDTHPDNGRNGYWRVIGIRHEATTRADSARQAVEKCVAADAVGSWESPGAVFLGEELPDVF